MKNKKQKVTKQPQSLVPCRLNNSFKDGPVRLAPKQLHISSPSCMIETLGKWLHLWAMMRFS